MAYLYRDQEISDEIENKKKAFVDRFRKLAGEKKTAKEIAEVLSEESIKIGGKKVSTQTVYKWLQESNPTMPEKKNCELICKVYRCDLNYLLMEKTEDFNMEYKKISEITGLSSEALRVIENSDHTRKVLLNLILSDRAVFEALMDCLYSLCWPSTITIDIRKPASRFAVKKTDGTIDPDHIAIRPEDMNRLSADVPDNIYSKMRQIIESFKNAVPDWSLFAEDIIVEDEDEEHELDEVDHGSKSGRREEGKR